MNDRTNPVESKVTHIGGWYVEVAANGERVLCISDDSVTGLDDIEPFAPIIRTAAAHLLSFIGPGVDHVGAHVSLAPAMAAAAPADERAALPQIPDLVKATAWLTMCLRTELSRLDDDTHKALDEVEAQLSCVRAITNGAIDYEAMVAARAAASPAAEAVPDDCDVRKILLNVVPGMDGEGHEVYARNVADVEQLLSEMGERLDAFESTPQPAQADAPAEARAKSISDEMMDLADRLGSEWKDVDPRAWQHLLVYAPAEAFPYQKTFNAIAAATSVEGGHVSISVKAFRDAFGGAVAEAREPIAWVTDDDRAITAAQKQRALADGGATASSVRPYSIPCYAVSAPADAGEAVAHMRVRSTDAGSTSHAIDIAPEAAALDLKPGEYLLYLAPPTTRAAHLTTTLSPDQRISMAAKLFFLANELLNGADQS